MRRFAAALAAATVATLAFAAGSALAGNGIPPLKPTVGTAVAFDKSAPLRSMPMIAPGTEQPFTRAAKTDRSLTSPVATTGHQRDGALQNSPSPNSMSSPLFTFEGPSNEANFDIFGFRVNPPDPNGDVGQHNYVAMVNLTFAIYSKTGTLQYGPADTGSLWQGFSVPDCTDPSGDPVDPDPVHDARAGVLQLRRGFDD
jgi:hypothetical protein